MRCTKLIGMRSFCKRISTGCLATVFVHVCVAYARGMRGFVHCMHACMSVCAAEPRLRISKLIQELNEEIEKELAEYLDTK